LLVLDLSRTSSSFWLSWTEASVSSISARKLSKGDQVERFERIALGADRLQTFVEIVELNALFRPRKTLH
jgi:hypothetical protein